ncbi:hypothetical protein [Pseudobacter ginsenosidimutans]|nr:hypothetical protein [Pseudobacter ginsenosidimutans]QEC42189.1 hypothetical protein FSB84_10995 [Pseudobacter ginsenosidimutans]
MVAIFLRDGKQWLSRGISTLLLLLFALSITPKKILHDLIVHHEDDISYHTAATPGFVKSGFHCDTDNNVAESPFTSGDPVTISKPPVEFISFNDVVNSSLHSITAFYFSLRGPPAIS